MPDDKIDQILERHRGRAEALIQVLLEIQSENRWIPYEVMAKISRELEVPLSRVLQIVTFHKTFRLMPGGRHDVQVCTGSSCHIRGSRRLLEAARNLTGTTSGEKDSESKFRLETCSCRGSCSLGPEIIVDGKHHGRMTPDKIEDVLKGYK